MYVCMYVACRIDPAQCIYSYICIMTDAEPNKHIQGVFCRETHGVQSGKFTFHKSIDPGLIYVDTEGQLNYFSLIMRVCMAYRGKVIVFLS